MKISKIALAMGFSMTLVSGVVSAAGTTPAATTTTTASTNQGHGTVHFKGEIIDAPCSVAPKSADQTVDLGQISNASLEKNGKSTPVPFEIQLLNCNIATLKTVTAVWSGTQDVHKTDAWGIAGTASGAAVVITDASNKPITLGSATAPTTLTANTTTIDMSAYLQGDGEPVVPGDFTSVADFTLTYQ